MTEQQVKDLQDRLKVLEAENAMLIEQAEDAQLLGALAETISAQGDLEGMLDSALEKLALLKALDLVALCRKLESGWQIERCYQAEGDEPLQGVPLHLADESEQLLGADDACRLLPQLQVPCKELLLIPFEAAVFGAGLVLLGHCRAEDGSLQDSRAVLSQVVETLALNLENRLLLQSFQQANINLDRELSSREQQLENSETLFRTVIEQAHEAFFLHDNNGRFLQVNERACASLGYSKEELLQLTVVDVDESLSKETFKLFLANFSGTDHQRIRSLARCKDGRTFPVEVNVSHVQLAGEDYFLALVQDISELVKLEELQLQLDLLMDNLPDVVSMLKPDGEVVYLNQAGRELFGISRRERLQLRLSDLMPERAAKRCLETHIPKALEEGTWTGESLLVSAAREVVPTLQTIVAPRDKTGQQPYIFCIERDLRELRRLEEQFVQAQKMEAIGTLVGGLAHDFNNLLAGIMGNLFLLLKKTEEGPQKERLKSIQQMCQGAAGMISQLLIFARKDLVKIEPVRLKRFMQEFSKMYQVLIPENISFELGTIDADLVALTDVSQLQQVLVNLLTNARDALDGRSNPTIGVSIEPFDADEAFITKHADLAQRELICLTVIDNGCGIADEVRDRIFDPFFTTKKLSKGTGLGLAMVFGAVQRQGGCLAIDSHPGQGTIVRLYLPRLREVTDDIRLTKGGELSYGQGELILLADDDSFVRDSHQEALVQLGYRVLAAADGIQALEALDNFPQIELAILDVVMPNLDGVSAGAQMRSNRPELPILYMTGYAERLDRQQALPAEAEVLTKPATMAELSQKIAQLLKR